MKASNKKLDRSSNKSWTAYGRTQVSFDPCSKYPQSTIDLAAQQHSQSVYFQTQHSFHPNNKRRSFGQNLHCYVYTEPSRCITPQRSKTSISRPSYNERLMDMVSKSKEKQKRRSISKKRRYRPKMNYEKSQQEEIIQQALLQIEQQNKYHKKFMAMINSKVDLHKKNTKPKLRQHNQVEQQYTEPVFRFQHERKIPDYLQYVSSFYSRSKRRCFKEVPDDLYPKKEMDAEQVEKQYFSYLKFVADMAAKKRFQETFKTKKNFNGIEIMKSKQKILSLWRNGSKNQQLIKALIEEILKEKKLI